jgi:predicted nucleic acid-binding protein
MPSFIDTNVLLYAQLTDQANIQKQRVALEILKRPDCVLSVQVMQEFYVQATRISRPGGIGHDKAIGFIRVLSRFKVQDLTMDVLNNAFDITSRYRFSYWDSAIIAAALAAKCDTLFTEDLHHGQVIDGLKIVNPFKED